MYAPGTAQLKGAYSRAVQVCNLCRPTADQIADSLPVRGRHETLGQQARRKVLGQVFRATNVLIRSPGRRGIDPGATTAQSTFKACNE